MAFLLAAAINLAVAFALGLVAGGVVVWWRMTGTKGRSW